MRVIRLKDLPKGRFKSGVLLVFMLVTVAVLQELLFFCWFSETDLFSLNAEVETC